MGLDLARLNEKEQKTIVVYFGNVELEFYAYKPSSEDRINYRRDLVKCFNKRGEADLEKVARVQRKWAKRMLTGFREGDLLKEGKPLDPKDEEWKAYLEDVAPEILENICVRLFEENIEVDFLER